jgi:hypothetical protein
MTEPIKGSLRWRDAVLCLGGALLLIVGSLLPLWSKNGIGVNAWEGDYLSVGRWLLVAAALGGVCAWALPAWRHRATLLGLCGGLALLLAGLILWEGYKLGAIGMGAWVVLMGAFLILGRGLVSR